MEDVALHYSPDYITLGVIHTILSRREVYFREHEAQVLCNIIKMLNKRLYSPPSSAAVIYLMLPNMVLQILYITAGGKRFHSETTIVSDFQASVPMHGVHARSRFICRCWRPPKLALVTSVR